MKLDIHYINLDHDKERNDRTHLNLSTSFKGKEPIRFPGIYGKDISNSETLSSLGKHVCSHKMIGCGISHIELAKTLVDSENDFNLIFEDDILILNNSNIDMNEYVISEIEKVNKETNNKWDIVKFHNIGTKGFSGSTAGYALSKTGAEKLSKQMLHFHIDIIMNNGYDLYVVENDIFKTNGQSKMYNNSIYNIKILDQRVGWYLNKDCIYNNIKTKHLILITFIIFCLSIYFKSFEIFTAYLIIIISFVLFMFKMCNIINIPKAYNIGIIQYVTFVFAYTIIQIMSKDSRKKHSITSEYVIYFTIFILCIHMFHKHAS